MANFVTKIRNSSQRARISSQKFTKLFFRGIFATIENEYINNLNSI